MTTEETVSTEAPAAENSMEHIEGEDAQPRRLKRFTRRVTQRLRVNLHPALLALLVVASTALAAGLLYFQYRPDRATDATAAKAAITAASEGTVAILSYSPDNFDRDFSSAKSRLTGDFLSYYSQFTQQIVGPAAKQKSVKTSAVVVRAAALELHPDSAVVLVFINQSTVSADRPEPTLTSSSVLVTVTKPDNKWLISAFNPV
ncbi:MAG: Mce-associated rane protein [Mycobacterium sp.]|nr:Mce-associated rane protein [Mycobacterium sp.]